MKLFETLYTNLSTGLSNWQTKAQFFIRIPTVIVGTSFLPSIAGLDLAQAESLGDTLSMYQTLENGQYLRSQNGAFVAVLQSDANFVVYRGTSDSDISHGNLYATNNRNGGCPCFVVVQNDGNFVIYHGTNMNNKKDVVWASNVYTKDRDSGPYFLVMQDDGNLVEYHGKSGADRGGVQWASGHLDPVTGFDNIQDYAYNLAAAHIVSTSPVQIFNQEARNDTNQIQVSTIQGGGSVADQSGWSDSITRTVGVKDGVTIKIPLVFDNQFEVSTQIQSAHGVTASTTTSKTWNFSTPLSLQPHTSGRVVVTVDVADITVPYNLNGSIVYKSGTRVPINSSGVYTGKNSYDMKVLFTDTANPAIKSTILQERKLVNVGGKPSIVNR